MVYIHNMRKPSEYILSIEQPETGCNTPEGIGKKRGKPQAARHLKNITLLDHIISDILGRRGMSLWTGSQ
jgi:hypothetical protein